MSIAGTWDVRVATPIGTQRVELTFSHDDAGWHGWAEGSAERVELHEIIVSDHRVSWSQSVTKPIRLNLRFEVEVDTDQLSGTSKAGRLPASKVSGRRTAAASSRRSC